MSTICDVKLSPEPTSWCTKHDIIEMADELDDRWLGCASGWAGGKSGHHLEMPGVRFGTTRAEATLRPASADLRVKGDAPGNARGAVARRATVHGKCHREDTASVAYPGDSPEENLRDVFEWNATKVRVKRWGKSPPLRQQWQRQGKPRVVQDQIGGQSRPGSLSELERASSLLCGASSAKG
jgi:hypothetical protein